MSSFKLTVIKDFSRLHEIPETIELETQDGQVTANRTLLRLASSVIHTKFLEDLEDLTVIQLVNHKRETVENLLNLIYDGGQVQIDGEAENQEILQLAEELGVNIQSEPIGIKKISVEAPKGNIDRLHIPFDEKNIFIHFFNF